MIRLAGLNYYATPDTLSQILREGVGEQVFLKDRVVLPQRAETYQRLTNLTGIRIPDLYAASAHHFAPVLTPPGHPMKFLETESDITRPLLAPALAAKQLRPAHAGQFCPLCLRDAAYHRLFWMPIAMSACLEHSCLLKDRCQHCNKSISIREIVEARCHQCRGALTEAEVIPLNDDLGLLFQRIFQSWFMRNTTPSAANLLLTEQQPGVLYRVIDGLQWATRMVAGHKWPDMHRLGIEPQDLAEVQDKVQRVPTSYESYSLYSTAGKGMRNWPEGFYEFLDACRNWVQQDKPLNSGPKADLGNLYTQWLRDYWRHPAFEFVHKAFERYFIHSYSLSSAVVRTNLCREKTEILELRSKWNEKGNRTEAAEWLGTTKKMVLDLVEVGLLSAEYSPVNGFPHWIFHRSALDECLAHVAMYVKDNSVQEKGKQEPLMNLANASRLLFVVGLNAASILLHVTEGKLHAYYAARQKLRLGALLFDRSDIQKYIQRVKTENGWISREEVAKFLGIKDMTLARWVKVGLLSPVAIYGHIQYFNQTTIDRFRDDHITSEEAAQILKMGKLAVQKWARTGRLFETCVSGPNIDGYHAYLFNKEKLLRWRNNRLTFGEASHLLGVSRATLHRWVAEGKIQPLDDMGGKQRWFSRQATEKVKEKARSEPLSRCIPPST